MTLNGQQVPSWIEKLLIAAVVAFATWVLTSFQASAVQQQRIVTIEQSVETKASKESVENIEKRLTRIEDKLDKALERKK